MALKQTNTSAHLLRYLLGKELVYLAKDLLPERIDGLGRRDERVGNGARIQDDGSVRRTEGAQFRSGEWILGVSLVSRFIEDSIARFDPLANENASRLHFVRS